MENVRRLAGKGIEGLEDCPPLFHIDFSEDEFARLQDDPREFLESLDQEPLTRIGLQLSPDIPVTFATKPYPAHSDAAAEATQEAKPERRRGCCYTTDEGMVCHPHG